MLPDMSEVMMHLEDAVEADDSKVEIVANKVEIVADNSAQAVADSKVEITNLADDSVVEIANVADDSMEIAKEVVALPKTEANDSVGGATRRRGSEAAEAVRQGARVPQKD